MYFVQAADHTGPYHYTSSLVLLLPPGLYKQLITLKDLIAEYREKPEASSALKAPIIDSLNLTGE